MKKERNSNKPTAQNLSRLKVDYPETIELESKIYSDLKFPPIKTP